MLQRKAVLRPFFSLTLVLTLLCAPGLSAQTPPKEQAPTITVHTELVQVPVIVHSKNGEHVSGLKKSDFTLLENDKEQAIATFEEVSAASGKIAVMALPPGVYSNVVTSDATKRPLTIICLDALNSDYIDQMRARKAMIDYLTNSLQAGTPTMVVLMRKGHLELVQDITSDPAVLVAAVSRIQGRSEGRNIAAVDPTRSDALASSSQVGLSPNASPDPGFGQGAGDAGNEAFAVARIANSLNAFANGQDSGYPTFQKVNALRDTLEMFQHIAQTVSGMPGRKSLIWVTGSFPQTFLDPSDIFQYTNVAPLYEKTLQVLNSANMAVYPVDMRGLLVQGPDVTACTSCGGLTFGARSVGTPQMVSSEMRSNTSTLEVFAAMTGGRAYYNRNEMDASFKQAASEASSYYMLGYYLEKRVDTKPGWRKLKVKVNAEKVTILYRTGFFATPFTLDTNASAVLDISTALRAPLNYTAIPVFVRWTGTDDKKQSKFDVVLPANTPTIEDDMLNLEFAGVAHNATGEDAGHFSQGMRGKVPPAGLEQIRSSGITYHGAIALAPGQYTVRFVVRDNISGRMGSVLAPITVQ